MSKRSFQIISLILSVISLIYLILSHYGYIRYAQITMMPTSHYVEKYKALPKNKDRVVVSFKFDENAKNLKGFICSLLDQTVRIDDIAVVIPYSNISKIPENIKQLLTVIGYKKDYDSCENIICSVLKEPENNTKILLLKPKIYGKDYVQTMLEESKKHPNSIIKQSDSYLIKPAFFTDKITQCSSKDEDDIISQCANSKIHVIEYKDNL